MTPATRCGGMVGMAFVKSVYAQAVGSNVRQIAQGLGGGGRLGGVGQVPGGGHRRGVAGRAVRRVQAALTFVPSFESSLVP